MRKDVQVTINISTFRNLFLVLCCCMIQSRPSFVISAVLAVGFFLSISKPESLIGPIFFLSIFDESLVAFPGMTFSRICVLIFSIGVLLRIVSLDKGAFRPSLFVFSLGFIGLIFSFLPSADFRSIPGSYLTNIIFCICLMECEVTSVDKVNSDLTLYSICALLYALFLFVTNGAMLVNDYRYVLNIRENVNAISGGLSLAGMVFIYKTMTSNRFHLVYFLMFVLDILCLFLMGSRTATISMLVSCIICWVEVSRCVRNRDSKVSTVKLAAILILFVACISIIYSFLTRAMPNVMVRFTLANIQANGATGRFDAWRAIITEILPSNLLLGIGFDPLNIYYRLQDITGFGHGSHNILLEALVKTGLIGTLAYFVFFVSSFKSFFERIYDHIAVLMPVILLITVLLNALGEDGLVSRMLWMTTGLSYMYCYNV